MSRDSVRYGRVPKRSKERNDESQVSQSEPEPIIKKEVVDSTQSPYNDIIQIITTAHTAFCSYTEDKIESIIKKPIELRPEDVQGSDELVNSLQQQKLVLWTYFSELMSPSVMNFVEFAKRLPGFNNLTQDDQLILIKRGFFETWLMQVSRMLDPLEKSITFHDGSCVSKQQLHLIFDQDFVSSVFDFAVNFNNLKLDDNEIGLLSAVVVLSPDRSGIVHTKFIKQQQSKVIEALKINTSQRRSSDDHYFSLTLLKINELRTLGKRHDEFIEWFRINWDQVSLAPLFSEIYDIPKREDVITGT